MNTVKARKAVIADVKDIQKLVNEFAKKGAMIPRSVNELYENIRDFTVCHEDGTLVGVCALHILWEDLAEVRSLAVRGEFQGRGIGKKLVRHCMKEAKAIGVKRVFVLTYQTDFFQKMGFAEIDKASLPQKIWGDCVRCPKFPDCDEYALATDI